MAQLGPNTVIRHQPRVPAVTPVQVARGEPGQPGPTDWDAITDKPAIPDSADDIGAETPAGAQAKADQAEANAKAASMPRIVQYAFKPIDTVRNNTAVLAADPHLVIPVKANGVYLVEGYLAYQATTTADLSVLWQVGATLPTMRWNPLALAASAAGSTSAIQRATFTNTVAISMGGTGTAVDARPQGLVWAGPADGDFKLMWAQSVAEASDVTLFAGSWLRLTKVG